MMIKTGFLPRRVVIILCVFALLVVNSYLISVDQSYHTGLELQGVLSKTSKPSTSGILSNDRLKPLPVDQSYEETSAYRGCYLFFMEINEQLSANLEKFFQLCYFSALWNFKMVEPWMDNLTEYLSSLPPTGKPQSPLFLDLYNRTALQKILTKCHNSN